MKTLAALFTLALTPTLAFAEDSPDCKAARVAFENDEINQAQLNAICSGAPTAPATPAVVTPPPQRTPPPPQRTPPPSGTVTPPPTTPVTPPNADMAKQIEELMKRLEKLEPGDKKPVLYGEYNTWWWVWLIVDILFLLINIIWLVWHLLHRSAIDELDETAEKKINELETAQDELAKALKKNEDALADVQKALLPSP